MKISMIGTLPPIKGVSPYTFGLVKELSKKIEIDFYGFKSIYPEFLYSGGTKTQEKEPKIKNVNIINNLSWYNPFSWIKTALQIKTEKVHAQWWSWFLAPVYWTILKIAKARGKIIILTIHNVKPHEKSFIKNHLNNWVINLADEYIVHSQNNKELFLNETKTKKPIYVIPHGMITIKNPTKTKKQLRKEQGILPKEKIIIFFGNLRDYKGLDVLLKSISMIKDEKINLIVAGKPWGSFEEYEKIINKLKINKRIRLFLEFNSREKVAELFRISDLAIFPYKEFEASSGAGTVALNFKKAIVVTNVGGLPELIIDKNVVASPNDVNDLKEKIIYALNNLKKLEKDSKEIKDKFSWKKISKMTKGVYNGNTN